MASCPGAQGAQGAQGLGPWEPLAPRENMQTDGKVTGKYGNSPKWWFRVLGKSSN